MVQRVSYYYSFLFFLSIAPICSEFKKELVRSNLITMGSTNTKWTITSKGMKTLELIKEDHGLDEYS